MQDQGSYTPALRSNSRLVGDGIKGSPESSFSGVIILQAGQEVGRALSAFQSRQRLYGISSQVRDRVRI